MIYGNRVMTNLVCRRPRQNKANSLTDRKGRERAALPVPLVGEIVRNKTPTTKVPKSGFDPHFWANTKDQIGKSGLLSGASNKTPTTKVPKSGSDPRFWADIKDRFG